MTNSRRTFLKTVGLAVGSTGIATTAGANRSKVTDTDSSVGVPTTMDGWASERFDPKNTGYKPDGPTTTGFESAWRMEWNDRDTFDLVVADGTVFLVQEVGGGGMLYAVDAESGTVEWKAKTPMPRTGPTIVGDTVYLLTYYGLKAHDTSDGSLRWTYDGVEVDMNADESGVYVNMGGVLAAVNHDGTERWRYEISSRAGMGKPAIGDDVVVVGYQDLNPLETIALDIETGELRWKTEGVGSQIGSVAIRDDTAYVPVNYDGIAACDLETGHKKWEFEYEMLGAGSSDFVVTDDAVYVVGQADNSTIYRLDPETGADEVVWSGERITSALVCADDTFYFTVGISEGPAIEGGLGPSASVLYAVDRKTGIVRAGRPHDEGIRSRTWQTAPIVADGRVFVGSTWENDDDEATERLAAFELTESDREMIPDERPTARIEVRGNEEGEDGTYVLDANGSTGFDESVTYYWDTDGDETADGTEPTITVDTTDSCGSFTVNLEVRDDDYRIGEAKVEWDGSDWSDGE